MGAMLDKRVAKLYSGVFLSVQYQQYKCYFLNAAKQVTIPTINIRAQLARQRTGHTP